MTRVLSRFILGAISGALIACAPPAPAATGATPETGNRNRSVLTTEELRSGNDQTLFDVVQRLRPDWLRLRGSTSIAAGRTGALDADVIQVYLDQIRVGGPEALKQLSVSRAMSLKFYTPGEAQQRFGNGNVNGAIQVVTAPPSPPT
jgi:hypothetical protein